MEAQTYTIAALLGRNIIIGLSFLIFIQAILEIRKASQAERYNSSEDLASLKWLRKRALFALDSENTVGRSNSCDIVIKSAYLNAKSFRLYLDCDEWIIEPFKKCDVYLNKELLEEKSLLEDGDKISVGRENFVFSITPLDKDTEEIND